MLAYNLLLLCLGLLVVQTQGNPYCPGAWTQFYDRDDPSGGYDYEALGDIRREYDGVCAEPLAIDVRLINGDSWIAGGNYIDPAFNTPSVGFICSNDLQREHDKPRCKDYKVRFCCVPENVCPSPGSWTRWYNRDRPSGTGDFETLSDIRIENPGQVCEDPINVEGQLLNGRPWQAAGEQVTVSRKSGLFCRNSDQTDRYCNDYQVRFCCLPESQGNPYCPGAWTQFYDRDDPSGGYDYEALGDIRREYDGVCAEPLAIDVRLLNGDSWIAGGNYIDPASNTPSVGFICSNDLQREHGKPRCKDYKVRFCCVPEIACPSPGGWTRWYNRDRPSGTGDFETLSAIRRENPGQVCEDPINVQGQLLDGRPWQAAGEQVTVSRKSGLFCRNSDQTDRYCNDYQVRFCCPPE